MNLDRYTDESSLQFDTLKELGSIGTGSAATALSTMLGRKIKMELPEVKLVEFNRAIYDLGGPEQIVAAVLAEFSGEMNGIMLFLQNREFINVVLEGLMGKRINELIELTELELSALTEVGNIIISSYVNALANLVGMNVSLSVPTTTVNMLGGIMNVPIVMYGYTTDKLMTINGTLECDGEAMNCKLLLHPDEQTLDVVMRKLGVAGIE